MKNILLIALFSFLTCKVSACLNGYHINAEGAIFSTHDDDHIGPFMTSFNQPNLEELLSHYNLKKIDQYSYKQKSDLSILLIKMGKFEEALQILEKLAKVYPEEYKIIANLGTVYELLGQNEKALKYIKEGLRLNPKSHSESEWIHVKILEAKIKLQSDQKWLSNHSILGINPQSYEGLTESDMLHKGYPRHKEANDALKMIRETDYQLHTRIPFTPVPDLITEKLLTEIAELSSIVYSVEYAYVFYQIAYYYSGEKNDFLSKKTEEMKNLFKKYRFHENRQNLHKIYSKNIMLIIKNRNYLICKKSS